MHCRPLRQWMCSYVAGLGIDHLLSASSGGNEEILVLRVVVHDEVAGGGIIVPANTHSLESTRSKLREDTLHPRGQSDHSVGGDKVRS